MGSRIRITRDRRRMLLWISDESLAVDGGGFSSTLSFRKGQLPRQSHPYSPKREYSWKGQKGIDDRTYDDDGGGTRKSIMRIIPSSTTTSRPEAAQKSKEQNSPVNSVVVFEDKGPFSEIGGVIRLISIPRSDKFMRQSSSSQYCRGPIRSMSSNSLTLTFVGKLGTTPILTGKTIGKIGSRDGLIDLTV